MKYVYTNDDLKTMTDEEAAAMADDVLATVKKIHPLMAGKRPEAQGAILADLIGTYLAGYPPHARNPVLATVLETAKNLIPITEKAMGNVWEGIEIGKNNQIN